jgi:acyl-CoA synthetase (NDP forming)
LADSGSISAVNAVFRSAYSAGRSFLYEYEVYEILSLLGLSVPSYIIIRDPQDITHSTLSLFSGSKLVCKIIAADVSHKQKQGGVKIVHKDLDFIRYTAEQMVRRFEEPGGFERATPDARVEGVRVEGVLLANYIDYSKDLGNEVLLGIRESRAFGPVISFSKGGTDAEHFAANFSPPNLILPPIGREWAQALQASTHIQKKYIAEGTEEYIDKIVEAEVKFSRLAVAFSSFFPSETEFVIKEFEVNPFIFDYNGSFIAIDGYASFEKKREEAEEVRKADHPAGTVPPSVRPSGFQPTNRQQGYRQKSNPQQGNPQQGNLRPFFEPDGIAVIGISRTDNNKPGNIIIKNLVDLLRDDMYCVNPKGGAVTISGTEFSLYRTVTEIEENIDLAVITVPVHAVIEAVDSCIEKNVKAVLLIPGGFSETTQDSRTEEEIAEKCREAGVRVMGPNCLGIVYAGDEHHPGINTFFIPEEKFKVNLEKEKNVAILSQSGAMGIMEIYNLRNAISPKVIVSYGNQLDVDPADLVAYFEDDPMVDVIGLYIEGFKPGAGRKFFDVTSECRKPIVVYKAGRTEAGALAAQSHTASMAGEYDVARAAMKQAGLIVADSMIDHGDLIKTFALLHDFKVSGNRVAVIANAGYEKTYAADNLGELQLAKLDDATRGRLEDALPPYVAIMPLLDLTPMVTDEQFEQCIDIMLSSPNVDALCISIVPQAQVIHTTDEEIEHYERNIASRIVETVHRHMKPVVVSVNVVSGADAVYNRFGQVMDSGGVPTYLTAERAMVCLNAFLRYKLIKEQNRISEWLR